MAHLEWTMHLPDGWRAQFERRRSRRCLVLYEPDGSYHARRYVDTDDEVQPAGRELAMLASEAAEIDRKLPRENARLHVTKASRGMSPEQCVETDQMLD